MVAGSWQTSMRTFNSEWDLVQVHAQQELSSRLRQAEEAIQQRDACLAALQRTNSLLFKHAQAVGSDVQVSGASCENPSMLLLLSPSVCWEHW